MKRLPPVSQTLLSCQLISSIICFCVSHKTVSKLDTNKTIKVLCNFALIVSRTHYSDLVIKLFFKLCFIQSNSLFLLENWLLSSLIQLSWHLGTLLHTAAPHEWHAYLLPRIQGWRTIKRGALLPTLRCQNQKYYAVLFYLCLCVNRNWGAGAVLLYLQHCETRYWGAGAMLLYLQHCDTLNWGTIEVSPLPSPM